MSLYRNKLIAFLSAIFVLCGVISFPVSAHMRETQIQPYFTDFNDPNLGNHTPEPPVTPEPPIPTEAPTPEPVTPKPATPEPTHTPENPPSSSQNESTAAPTATPPPVAATATPTPIPNYEEEVVPTPRATQNPNTAGSIARPKATLKPQQNTNDNTSDTAAASNYVKFATMNQKNNSLASTLFYGGVLSIALGVLGFIVLIILFIRNRRYNKNHHEGIFEEIEQAENRNRMPPPQYIPSDYYDDDDGYEPSSPVPPSPPPRPVNPNAVMPVETPMYTEEFSLDEVPRQARQNSAKPSQSFAENKPPSSKPSPKNQNAGNPNTSRFSTEEILREALRPDEE